MLREKFLKFVSVFSYLFNLKKKKVQTIGVWSKEKWREFVQLLVQKEYSQKDKFLKEINYKSQKLHKSQSPMSQ